MKKSTKQVKIKSPTKLVGNNISNLNPSKEIPFKSLGNLRKNTGHTTIYVGNLSYKRTNESIKALFQKYGGVSYANIIFDKNTAKSKGFGFVQMKSSSAANKAISELNGLELDGRILKVSIAIESQIESKNENQELLKTKKMNSIPEVAASQKRRKRDKGLTLLFNFLGKS